MQLTARLTQTCRKCGAAKHLDAFGPMARRPGHTAKTCRECTRARTRDWSRKNIARHTGTHLEAAGQLTCMACGHRKEASAFGAARASKSGIDSACLECRRAGDKKRYKANPESRRETARWGAIEQKFGMTREQWFALFHGQGGTCGICRVALRTGGGHGMDRACVDHDHKTGRVRGMLCAKCNQGIGLLRDDVSVLEAAAAYLKESRRG